MQCDPAWAFVWIMLKLKYSYLKVQKLSLAKIEEILAMTEPGELDLPTRKRLNEAMRRRFETAEGPAPHKP